MISQQEKDFFLSLFQKTPNIAMLHIGNDSTQIQNILLDFVSFLDGIVTYKSCINLDFEKFRLTARSFEYAVICNCLDSVPNHNKFIQEIYHSLENSANIILIVDKSKNNLQYLIELLDNNDFRAANSIDIFQDYYVVTGKKMHMWGNGL